MSSLISQVSERFTAIVLRLQAHIQELRVQGDVGNAVVLLIYVFVGLELVRMIWLRVRWLCHEIVVPLFRLAIDIALAVSGLIHTVLSGSAAHSVYVCQRCGDEVSGRRVALLEHLRDTSKRLSFYTGVPVVYGWPSSGGVLIKQVSAVEVEWLGLQRAGLSCRAENRGEEDVFCTHLRRLGARWYSRERIWLARAMSIDHSFNSSDRKSVDDIPDLEVGIPSSRQHNDNAAWVLRVSDTNGREATDQRCMLQLALSMEERCEVIQKLGGTLFDHAGECPGLRSVPEGDIEAVDLETLQADRMMGAEADSFNCDEEDYELALLQAQLRLCHQAHA